MLKDSIDVKAKMIDGNKFEIIFAMDEQTTVALHKQKINLSSNEIIRN